MSWSGFHIFTLPPLNNTLTSMEVLLMLNIGMTFDAMNPNKVGIKYSGSEFYVMYKEMPLGVAMVPPFYQPSHSNTTVQTQLVVTRVNILQAAALDLIRDATVNDRVPLRITGDVGARIRVLQINSPSKGKKESNSQLAYFTILCSMKTI